MKKEFKKSLFNFKKWGGYIPDHEKTIKMDITTKKDLTIEKEFKQYKYYLHPDYNHVYRTAPFKFSNGEPSLSVERYSFDFEKWGGHIHDHEKTRKMIFSGEIKEITKEEAEQLIKK